MKFITTEYVSKGHPDKIADQISDALLDEYLKVDPNAKVAIETLVKNHCIIIAGEVSCQNYHLIDIEKTVKHTIFSIGYNQINGLNPESITVINLLSRQSIEINKAVVKDKIAAGDQGFVVGYACDDDINYMPKGVMIARKIVQDAAEGYYGVGPDAKSQVTLVRDANNNILGIDSIVLSVMHRPDVDVKSLFNSKFFGEKVNDLEIKSIYVNPAGNWTVGGPIADCGLTGRKIVVDAYGSECKVGGGAFSGKDPSKVDRSGAYMARYIAKNIVANGLAKKCQVQLGYVIGHLDPVSFNVDTFGTSSIGDDKLAEMIDSKLDLSVDGMIKFLNLKRPIYLQTARYGHFGIPSYSWEQVDKHLFSDIYKKN